MISWIQRTFQQHFRAVFAVLLAVTIISFIATIGAAPGIGNGERRTTEQDFYGHNLANQADVNQILGDAELSISLQGYSPTDMDQVREFAFQRVAALHLADEWHLPSPAPDAPEMVDFIRHLPYFAGQDRQFDPQRYATVRAGLRANGRFGEAGLARLLADDYRIERVRALLGGPGYILPGDVKNDLAHEDTTWTLATASVDYASFKAAATPSEADLTKYFQANASRYQIPAKVSVGYVEFPAANYVGQVTVTDAEVRAYYDRNPGRFPKPAAPAPAKGAKAPEIKLDAAADFAAVRPKVEAELKLERARNLAAKDASDFSYALYQNHVGMGAPLQAFLAARHLTEKSVPSFTEEAAPAELGGTPETAAAAFQLTAQHFYSEATTTPAGAAVLLWKGNEAPRQPSLAEVRDRVKSDYETEQKRSAFASAGAKLKTDIAARMKQGATFEKAAAAAGAAEGLKVTVKTLPAFKLSDRPPDVSPAVLGSLDSLAAGQVSDLQFSGDEGVLVYPLSRKAPDLGDSSTRYAETRTREAMVLSRMTANAYLSEMVARQLKTDGARTE